MQHPENTEEGSGRKRLRETQLICNRFGVSNPQGSLRQLDCVAILSIKTATLLSKHGVARRHPLFTDQPTLPRYAKQRLKQSVRQHRLRPLPSSVLSASCTSQRASTSNHAARRRNPATQLGARPAAMSKAIGSFECAAQPHSTRERSEPNALKTRRQHPRLMLTPTPT